MQRVGLLAALIVILVLITGLTAPSGYAYPPIITASPMPSSTPPPAVMNVPAHIIVIHAAGAYLRSGPGTEYNVVDTVNPGTEFDVLGSTLDGKGEIWYLVAVADANSSWIAGSLTVGTVPEIDDDVAAVPNSPPQTPTLPPGANAWVNSDARARLRSGPGLHYPPLDAIPPYTPLRLVTAFTRLKYTEDEPDNVWYLVQIDDGRYGWIYSDLIATVLDDPRNPPLLPTPTVSPDATVVDPPPEIVLPAETVKNARTIYEMGQQMRNRPNRFIVIGDSTSAGNEYTLPAFCAFHWGSYRLGRYERLQNTINQYHKSFCTKNVTLRSGLSSSALLDPLWADPSLCEEGENALECELRRTRPTIALIYIGLVDITYSTTDIFSENLDTILIYLIEHGVIPVLHTVPSSDRMTAARGYIQSMDDLNTIIRDAAARYRLPLIDLRAAAARLPNQGCIEEGFHLSYRVDGVLSFTGDEQIYGKDLRELLTLQMLREIRANVMAEG